MRTFVRPGLVCLASNPETKIIRYPGFPPGYFFYSNILFMFDKFNYNMLSTEKISKEIPFRSIPAKSLKQSFDFRDNRPVAVSQTKLIETIQRAADIAEAAIAYPDRYLGGRQLNFSKPAPNVGYVTATPTFGTNLGDIGGEIKQSGGNSLHVEARLIWGKYRRYLEDSEGSEGWDGANDAIDAAGADRENFTLFTERKPCRRCSGEDNLGSGRYTYNDHITWSIHGDATAIAQNYVVRANDLAATGYIGTPVVEARGNNDAKIRYDYPQLPPTAPRRRYTNRRRRQQQ